MYVYIYMIIYKHIYVYVCTYIHVYICTYIYVYIHVYIYIYLHIHIYIHTSTFTNIYTYLYVYVCMYTHTHTQLADLPRRVQHHLTHANKVHQELRERERARTLGRERYKSSKVHYIDYIKWLYT